MILLAVEGWFTTVLTAAEKWSVRWDRHTATRCGIPTDTAFVVHPPGVPRNVSVAAGVGSLTVKWAQPSSSGSSAISAWDIHYSYQETTGAATSTQNKTRRVTGGGIPTDGVTLTGLEYGTTYQVRIRAWNSWGSGSYSSPISTRTTVPGSDSGRFRGYPGTAGLGGKYQASERKDHGSAGFSRALGQ